MILGDLKKNIFSNPKGGPLCFQKRKSALVGVFLEKNPMTNKIKKFLYILEHLIPDGRDEIPTFALYHPLLPQGNFHADDLESLHEGKPHPKQNNQQPSSQDSGATAAIQ